jgi:hypothetical protein
VAAVDGFVEAMTASPLGVTLLAALESRTRQPEGFALSLETSPASVASATKMVETMSFGTFADLAVLTGAIYVGPWIGDAPSTVAAAYRDAAARLPIAEAVAERFGDELHSPLGHAAQQWWTDGAPGIESLAPLFDRFDDVYGAGEFTWSGLWTATDPPPEALAQMVGAWELETGPITRWWLPVRPEARVYEIHRPEDWARLATAHPLQASPHPGWELPGINQHHHHICPLLAATDQRAARASVRRHVVPDWRSVAGQYDGIHLSWAGFITAEGCIVDLAGGDVTMLRYWFSERTLWLADVFTEPRLAPDPHINLSSGSQHRPPLAPRVAVNRDFILGLLGRRHAR